MFNKNKNMKSLKECLVNEVRLTVKNAKVVPYNKPLSSLEADDIVWRVGISGEKATISRYEVAVKSSFGRVLIEGGLNEPYMVFDCHLPGSNKADWDYCIYATSEKRLDELIEKYNNK